MSIVSRRFLHPTPLYDQPPASGDPATVSDAGEPGAPGSSFDANVVMILPVLLCGLICALSLNSIVRCALRCSNRTAPEAEPGAPVWPGAVARKALRSLPTVTYSGGLKLTGAGAECAICLSEFVAGERVRVLPKCSHGFHARCVDRWLLVRPSCPTCRRCLFGSFEMASGCAGADRAGPAQSVIVPLEPEGLIADYR